MEKSPQRVIPVDVPFPRPATVSDRDWAIVTQLQRDLGPLRVIAAEFGISTVRVTQILARTVRQIWKERIRECDTPECADALADRMTFLVASHYSPASHFVSGMGGELDKYEFVSIDAPSDPEAK